MSTPPQFPPVFISYTHDSPSHDQRVCKLTNDLRAEGFDADLDQFHANQDWPLWMEKSIAGATYVLVVCTETYLRRWNNDEKPGKGLGAQWESRLTRQHLYESPTEHDKFIPVVFDHADLAHIPTPLRNVTRVVLADGLDSLLNRLRNIAPGDKAPLRTSLAPIALADGFFSHEPETTPNLHDGPEELISNLFPVDTPSAINTAELFRLKSAKGFHSLVDEAWTSLGRKGPHRLAYIVEKGTVYSFDDFQGEVWQELFRRRKLKPAAPIPTTRWSQSKVLAERNLFTKLLNQTLRQHCGATESPYPLIFAKSMDCYLFQAQQGIAIGSLAVKALKSNASRMVFKAIPDKRSETPGAIQHWQHEAFRWRWHRFGSQWYLTITPFWAFTGDGVSSASRFQKRSSANMRKPEKNRAVLGHVMFWRSVLCREPDLVRGASVLQIRPPVSLQASPSIRDQDWFTVAGAEERRDLQTDLALELP